VPKNGTSPPDRVKIPNASQLGHKPSNKTDRIAVKAASTAIAMS